MLSLFIILLMLSITFSLFLLGLIIKVRKKKLRSDNLSGISIIVAARNEERHITKLLDSLVNQKYDNQRYEIILIDDNSEDETRNLAVRFARDNRSLKVIPATDKKLPGKKGALQIGLNNAKYDYVVITDADCFAGPEWLNNVASGLSGGAGIVFGPVAYKKEKSLTNSLTIFESTRSQLLMFGLAVLELPYSAKGANFAYLKSLVENLGGYSKTAETLSGDDDLLIREAVKKRTNIEVMCNPESIITTYSEKTLSDYLKQKSRHVTTSNHYLFEHQILLAIWHLVNLVLTFGSLFMLTYSVNYIYVFAAKLISDAIIVKLSSRIFNMNISFVEALISSPIYEFTVVYNYIRATFFKKTITWKDNTP